MYGMRVAKEKDEKGMVVAPFSKMSDTTERVKFDPVILSEFGQTEILSLAFSVVLEKKPGDST
jgi:hypothetical protein